MDNPFCWVPWSEGSLYINARAIPSELTESRGWVCDGFPYGRLFGFLWSGRDHGRRGHDDGWRGRFHRSLRRRGEQGGVLRANVVVDAPTVCAIGRQDLGKIAIC